MLGDSKGSLNTSLLSEQDRSDYKTFGSEVDGLVWDAEAGEEPEEIDIAVDSKALAERDEAIREIEKIYDDLKSMIDSPNQPDIIVDDLLHPARSMLDDIEPFRKNRPARGAEAFGGSDSDGSMCCPSTKKCYSILNALYDGFFISLFVVDIILDVIITLQFRNEGHMVFFWASIGIFAIAQVSLCVCGGGVLLVSL
jgi:hypothetical protein